jgi:hypothetical protein
VVLPAAACGPQLASVMPSGAKTCAAMAASNDVPNARSSMAPATT